MNKRLAGDPVELPSTLPPVEWRVEDQPVAYPFAVAAMEERVAAIRDGRAPELVWLLEHPPLYTAGTSADPVDLIDAMGLPIFATGRGGQYTYHGPGQRVAYVMLDLAARGPDVRRFVAGLEAWLIGALDALGVSGGRREDRVGVWVRRPEKPPHSGQVAEDKIAAIGIRVRRWVTFHGVSLNVEPDLSRFSGIVPCGVCGHGVTSLADLGHIVSMSETDMALRAAFEQVFGATIDSGGSNAKADPEAAQLSRSGTFTRSEQLRLRPAN